MSTDAPGETVTHAEITRRIHHFILTSYLDGENQANLTESTPLISSGIIDSLSLLELGPFLLQTFAVHVSPEELTNPEHMETIASIVALIVAKRAAATQA